MTACPVRAFTTTTRRALKWFDRTHEIVQEIGGQRLRRREWPSGAAIGEQDPQIVEAFETIAGATNRIIKQIAEQDQKRRRPNP